MSSAKSFQFNVQDVLDGKTPAPVMPGPNPYPLWTDHWYAWKEINENYVPYHVPPDGGCPTMPRVVRHGTDQFRCPKCGRTFPTAVARLAKLGIVLEPEPKDVRT